jgi:hypothetical protein
MGGRRVLALLQEGCLKKENTEDARKCFNLEHLLEAEEMDGDVPEEVDMSVYAGEVDRFSLGDQAGVE